MSSADYSIAVLISGNGSNLQAIIDAINQGELPAKISLVISDRENAFGLERAKKAQIKTVYLNPHDYPSRDMFDEALAAILEMYSVNLVVLAGFMRILGSKFVQRFVGHLINIHPSILPYYKGLNTHQAVLDAGEKIHGTTVHFVTESLDGGPIIAQTKLTIQPEDTVDTLKNRIQKLEHKLYPTVIKWFAEKKLRWRTNGIYLNEKKIPDTGIEIQF